MIYYYWNDYIIPKKADKAKIFYMDTGCFIAHAKHEDTYTGFDGDIEKIFDTSNYNVRRQPPCA